MGILWRLLAPKPLKRARRTVRKATHPVHTAVRAATPKPVKKLQRAAHPLSLAELKAEDVAVNAVRGRPTRTRKPVRNRARDGSATRQGAVGGTARARPVQSRTPLNPAPLAARKPGRQREPSPAWPLADDELRRQQIQAEVAERYARRQARISDRAAARQAKAAGRAAVSQMKASARRERRAAVKAARGPWRWAEWSLIAGLAALVAWFTLVCAAAGKPSSAPGLAAIPCFPLGALATAIAGPAVIWRRHRAAQAAAARAHPPGTRSDPSPAE